MTRSVLLLILSSTKNKISPPQINKQNVSNNTIMINNNDHDRSELSLSPLLLLLLTQKNPHNNPTHIYPSKSTHSFSLDTDLLSIESIELVKQLKISVPPLRVAFVTSYG